MHRWIWLVSLLWLAACAPHPTVEQQASMPADPASPGALPSQPTPTPVRAAWEDFGPAPELTNEVWLNSDQPLRLADLRGQVVLLEMWTFG